MSKGDKNRITNQAKFNKEFDRIFNKKGEEDMSEFKDFLEQHIDTIDSDWQKEMVEVNKKRERLGLPHKVFTEEERGTFEKKWLEDRSI
jgi:catalase (peroxidase I)